MAYLSLTGAGITVKVFPTTPLRKEEPVGQLGRAFSGAPRSSVRAYYAVWEGVETAWISRATWDTLRAALKAAPPIAVTGDLTGSINVYFQNIREVEKGRKIVTPAVFPTAVEAVRVGFDILAA